MRIELVGVERLVVVIYGQFAIEARDVITGEEVGRHLPVCIAMFYLVGVSVVFVGQVVKGDQNGLPIQFHHRHRLPVVASHHLQRGDARAEDFGSLGSNAQVEEQKQ